MHRAASVWRGAGRGHRADDPSWASASHQFAPAAPALGHALQARREGLEIERITLWLFGGVAKFRGMFPSAGAEFRIAIAGPLVTLLVGAACLLATALLDLPASVDGVVAWLGYINLVLLAFNLLPALPLDGGRVLRSALWQARREFGWATRVAAGIGRGPGFVAAGGVRPSRSRKWVRNPIAVWRSTRDL